MDISESRHVLEREAVKPRSLWWPDVYLSFCEEIDGCLEKLAHALVSFLVILFQSQGS